MTPRGHIFAWLIALGAAACVTGCNRAPASPGAADAGAPILVGHFNSLTGAEATFGQSTSRGIRMALDEINAAGGLNGRPIRLIEYDTRGDPREAGVVVTRLIASDRVAAVLGESASGVTLAAAPVAQQAGVPLITPSSTSPRVTRVGEMIFRVCFIDTFQGRVCAQFAHDDLRGRRAALLFDQGSPYSAGLADEFRREFRRLGGQIVSEQTYAAGDQDFAAQLTAIRTAAPDVLFSPGYYTDGGAIAVQARKLGLSAPILGADGWSSPKLAELGGPAAEGLYYSDHYAPEDPAPQIRAFVAEHERRFGIEPESGTALGYDAMRLLVDAMRRARSLAGRDLADALAATRDFAGVTGTITIDAERNAVKPAVILQIRDGRPRYVATKLP